MRPHTAKNARVNWLVIDIRKHPTTRERATEGRIWAATYGAVADKARAGNPTFRHKCRSDRSPTVSFARVRAC